MAERASRLRDIRWDTGSSLLPPELEGNLSAQEREFYDRYGKCILAYQQELGLDVMAVIQDDRSGGRA